MDAPKLRLTFKMACYSKAMSRRREKSLSLKCNSQLCAEEDGNAGAGHYKSVNPVFWLDA